MLQEDAAECLQQDLPSQSCQPTSLQPEMVVHAVQSNNSSCTSFPSQREGRPAGAAKTATILLASLLSRSDCTLSLITAQMHGMYHGSGCHRHPRVLTPCVFSSRSVDVIMLTAEQRVSARPRQHHSQSWERSQSRLSHVQPHLGSPDQSA